MHGFLYFAPNTVYLWILYTIVEFLGYSKTETTYLFWCIIYFLCFAKEIYILLIFFTVPSVLTYLWLNCSLFNFESHVLVDILTIFLFRWSRVTLSNNFLVYPYPANLYFDILKTRFEEKRRSKGEEKRSTLWNTLDEVPGTTFNFLEHSETMWNFLE